MENAWFVGARRLHRRVGGRLLITAIVAATAACGGGSAHPRAAVRTSPNAASASTVGGTEKSTASTTAPHGSATSTSVVRVGGATSRGGAGTADRTATVSGSSAPGSSSSSPAPPAGSVCVPVKYDPPNPVNLCGTPGVSSGEQARAERLVRDTLRDLPKYASTQTAYNNGYRSIGDSPTGYEHWVKWSLVDDGHILDSTQPESLVYHVVGGARTLVAAMYMTPKHTRFTDLPDIGGTLTQWHIHNDLCFRQNPHDSTQWTVTGTTDGNGNCPAGTTKSDPSPMIHVWIVSTPCGPFAALEGLGGGQVEPGESPACDRLHGKG